MHGYEDIVRELIGAGAKADFKNDNGKTPVDKAYEFEHDYRPKHSGGSILSRVFPELSGVLPTRFPRFRSCSPAAFAHFCSYCAHFRLCSARILLIFARIVLDSAAFVGDHQAVGEVDRWETGGSVRLGHGYKHLKIYLNCCTDVTSTISNVVPAM